jgi:hypothetical protein
MEHITAPPSFWTRWLLVASLGVMAFGLVLVVAPGLALRGFSLLVYVDPDRIASFGPEAARHVSLVHAVLGGVMVGWGMALALLVREFFAAGHRAGWNVVAWSVGAWFIPDTAYSLASGYWQNAALNVVFVVLFAVPLAATRKHFRGGAA